MCKYGYYVRDLTTQEVVYNITGFDNTKEAEEDLVEMDSKLPSHRRVTLYSYSDPEDPQVEEVIGESEE